MNNAPALYDSKWTTWSLAVPAEALLGAIRDCLIVRWE